MTAGPQAPGVPVSLTAPGGPLATPRRARLSLNDSARGDFSAGARLLDPEEDLATMRPAARAGVLAARAARRPPFALQRSTSTRSSRHAHVPRQRTNKFALAIPTGTLQMVPSRTRRAHVRKMFTLPAERVMRSGSSWSPGVGVTEAVATWAASASRRRHPAWAARRRPPCFVYRDGHVEQMQPTASGLEEGVQIAGIDDHYFAAVPARRATCEYYRSRARGTAIGHSRPKMYSRNPAPPNDAVLLGSEGAR